MKTELAKVAEQLNMTYTTHEKVMWGNYKGYKVAVKEDTTNWTYYFSIPLKQNEDSLHLGINDFIQSLQEDKKLIKSAYYKDYCLRIEMVMSRIRKKNPENLLNILDKIVYFAQNYSYVTCCENCGTEMDPTVYIINDRPVCACQECYHNTISHLEETKAKIQEKKGNLLTGTVGALLGSLIGAVVWVLVYSLGYVAAICGIAMAVCVIKGFELFGGKLNKVGITVTILITIAMVYISTYFGFSIDVYKYSKDYMNTGFLDVLRFTGKAIKLERDIALAFYESLIKGYVFAAIGAASTFYSAYQQANGKYKAKKLS